MTGLRTEVPWDLSYSVPASRGSFTVQHQRGCFTYSFFHFPKGTPVICEEHWPPAGERKTLWKYLSSPLGFQQQLFCTSQNILFWRSMSMDALGAESPPPLLSATLGGPMWPLPCAIHPPPSSWGAIPPLSVQARAYFPAGGEAVAGARPRSVFLSQVTAERSLSTGS